MKLIKVKCADANFSEGDWIRLSEPAQWDRFGGPPIKIPSGTILVLKKKVPGAFMAKTKEGMVFKLYEKYLKTATMPKDIRWA